MLKTVITIVVTVVIILAAMAFSRSSNVPSATDQTLTTPDDINAVGEPEQVQRELQETMSQVADLSSQNLTAVSQEIFSRTGLRELDLSDNQLSGALPAEVRQLQALRILNLSDNQFTGVPAEIGQLRNLEVLDLSNNNLTGLPYELGNLMNLQVLDLSGNDYSKQDLEIIKASLPPSVNIRVD